MDSDRRVPAAANRIFVLSSCRQFYFLHDSLQLFEIAILILLASYTVYQLFRILPYTRFYSKQVEKALEPIAENTIKMVIYNALSKIEIPQT